MMATDTAEEISIGYWKGIVYCPFSDTGFSKTSAHPRFPNACACIPCPPPRGWDLCQRCREPKHANTPCPNCD